MSRGGTCDAPGPQTTSHLRRARALVDGETVIYEHRLETGTGRHLRAREREGQLRRHARLGPQEGRQPVGGDDVAHGVPCGQSVEALQVSCTQQLEEPVKLMFDGKDPLKQLLGI